MTDRGHLTELAECRAPMGKRIQVDHIVSYQPRVCHLPKGHAGPHALERDWRQPWWSRLLFWLRGLW